MGGLQGCDVVAKTNSCACVWGRVFIVTQHIEISQINITLPLVCVCMCVFLFKMYGFDLFNHFLYSANHYMSVSACMQVCALVKGLEMLLHTFYTLHSETLSHYFVFTVT